MFNKSNFDSHREYLIPAIYCVSGALYIVGSDLLLGRFVTESNRLWTGTAKGIGFVFFTSLVLLLLLKYEKRRRANSEVFFRRLVESMQDAVLVLEVPERKIIYANEAASHIFGYSNAELLGQTSEILHTSKRNFEEFETRSAPALRDNKTFQADFEMRHRDGRTIPTAHSVSLIERKNRPALALSLVKDYTPLHLSAKKLQEQEKLLRQVAENLQEVFWISTGINDKPEYISPSYRDIWGRDPERLFDNPEAYLEAIHEDDREWVRQCRQTIIQGNYDIQFRIVRPDGEIRWIWDRARPIVNDEGEIYRIVGIAEDITALKKHEEELQHARKLKDFGHMASGITHDFRNYLTVIMGNLEVLQDEITSTELRDTLAMIDRATRDANNLTNRLLAFSRKQPLRPQSLELNRFISKLIQMISPSIPKGILIETQLEESLWSTRLDATILESSLINLIRNACDAMPQGGRIVVSSRNVQVIDTEAGPGDALAAGDYVCLEVGDNGPGMDNDTRLQVFDPYFTTKASGQGTGLGLSMTHGFVMQSGGDIRLNSEPGKGCTFSLYFPRHAGSPATPPADSTSTEADPLEL